MDLVEPCSLKHLVAHRKCSKIEEGGGMGSEGTISSCEIKQTLKIFADNYLFVRRLQCYNISSQSMYSTYIFPIYLLVVLGSVL